MGGLNQIFGYQVLPEDRSPNPAVFGGAEPVTLPPFAKGLAPQLRLFAYPRCRLATYACPRRRSFAYLWGIPAHPEINAAGIAKWCTEVVGEKRYGELKDLLGTFVLIVDEPAERRMTFVTDILGVRPMFYGRREGRLVFGSEVWPIHEAGLVEGNLNYDAVCSWISYRYNCTGGSLFAALRRLPAGSAVVFLDGKSIEIPYAEFVGGARPATAEQAAEDIHEIVFSTVERLLADHRRVSVALSGGYDSRYLLAAVLSSGKASVHCATVDCPEEEGRVASRVAQALGLPLDIFPVQGSEWDIYDQVFHFTADGFPISKYVPYCVAEKYSEMPMVNGFLGNPLVQGTHDTFFGKYEGEWPKDRLADVLQRIDQQISYGPFRPDLAHRIRTRSKIRMEEAVRKAYEHGKVFAWVSLYYRHRHYLSNNFLQHIGTTEALLPFYSWALIKYKMEHAYAVFGRDVYDRIFRRYFPALADIPHESRLRPKTTRPPRTARCAKRWAPRLAAAMCDSKWLSLLRKDWCMPRTIAGGLGVRRFEPLIFTLERLYLLERRARDANVNLDWDRL